MDEFRGRIFDRILNDDLRNELIGCGYCDFDETSTEDAVAGDRQDASDAEVKALALRVDRLATCVEGVQLETTRAITELFSYVKHIRETNESQTALIRSIDSRQAVMQESLSKYNAIRERLDVMEREHSNMHDRFIPRTEFNAALKSLRGTMGTLQWMFGLGFSAIVGLLAAILFV